MKTPHRICQIAGTVLMLFSAAALRAADPATPVAAAPVPADPDKPLSMFMGTDVSIEYQGKLYRIMDVTANEFIIAVDDKPVQIPMRGSPHNLKVDHALKLSANHTSVTGLVCERAYTPRNDPRMQRQIQATQVSTVVGDNASLAMGQFIVAQNKFGVAINGDSGIRGADISAANLDAAAAVASEKAFASAQMADAMMSSNSASGAFARLEADRDMLANPFDAVEVEFLVSSSTPLNNPFVVLSVNYLEKEDQPASARNMIYARPLEPIGSKPQKVHILQGGLPRGYTLKDYQVHLYNLGREVATEVAPNRVPLTREEAFRYLKANYLRQHKGATLAAEPVLGRLDAETKAKLTQDQLTGRYYVKVSHEGRPLAAFADEACTQPVNSEIAALTERVLFYPAMDKGTPVDGVSRLIFSRLNL